MSSQDNASEAYEHALTLIEQVRISGSAELDFSKLVTLEKIPPLGNLSAVRRINISGTKISDISPLSQLPALTTLDLDKTSVSDFSILSKLSAIEILHLSDTKFSDLHLLAGMSALRIESGFRASQYVMVSSSL